MRYNCKYIIDMLVYNLSLVASCHHYVHLQSIYRRYFRMIFAQLSVLQVLDCITYESINANVVIKNGLIPNS